MFSYYCLAHEQAENYITSLKQKYEFEVKYRNLDRPGPDSTHITNIENWSETNSNENKWVFVASHGKTPEDEYWRCFDSQCIVFLSKMNFDPMGIHDNPYMLDFIYTLPEYRETGLASNLIKHILRCFDFEGKTFDLVAIPDNKISDRLFDSLEFTKAITIGPSPILYSPRKNKNKTVNTEERQIHCDALLEALEYNEVEINVETLKLWLGTDYFIVPKKYQKKTNIPKI